MNEERIKVLEMLADGKITIDQANQLIETLSGAGESAAGRRYEENVRDLTEVRDQNSTLKNMQIIKEFTLYNLAPQDVTVAAGGRLILYGQVSAESHSGERSDRRFPRVRRPRPVQSEWDMTVDLYRVGRGGCL